MPHTLKDPASPTGLFRLVARAPIHLYHWRLGRLLGHRVLLLTHTGRVSRQPRQVVLEVVDHDPQTGTYLVASGFGTRSQWYRNIRHTPAVAIQVGGRRLAATAHPLTPEESGRAMARYALRHPRTARRLMRVCGLDVDGTADDYYLVGRDHIPFVRLVPVASPSREGGAKAAPDAQPPSGTRPGQRSVTSRGRRRVCGPAAPRRPR